MRPLTLLLRISLFAVIAALVCALSAQEAKGPKRGPGKKGGPDPKGLIKPTMADTIRVNVYADNWFVLFINGKLTAVDSIPFTPHNVMSFDILPEYPMTIAVMVKDNADPKTGLEYGDHIGDGGFILKFAGEFSVGGNIGPTGRGDLQEAEFPQKFRSAFQEPFDCPKPLGNSLGVVESVDAEPQDLRMQAVSFADRRPKLPGRKTRHRRRIDADRDRTDPRLRSMVGHA